MKVVAELHVGKVRSTSLIIWKGSPAGVRDELPLLPVSGLKVTVTGAGYPVTLQSTWKLPSAVFVKVGPSISRTGLIRLIINGAAWLVLATTYIQ